MAPLSPELIEALESQQSWAGAGEPEVVERLSLLLAWMPEPVRKVVLDDLIAAPERARALIQAIALASTAGARPVDALDETRIVLVDHQGHRFALSALAYTTLEHPNGEPEDVARLTALLDSTFQGRQYALYLRRAVPSGFNPGPVSRAVHLWLAAIDRGEWKGRHAIYEDDDVALELTLVQENPTRGGGRVMTVGPITALERLASVDSMVVELAHQHRQSNPSLPLVVALGAQPRWRVPRGYVEQLLYGTADWVEACVSKEGHSYSAQFRPNGRSMFSDPVCSALCALWWIEGTGPDPLAFRAWGHDNPWCDAPDRIPPVDVPRFVAQGLPRDGRGPEATERVLAWSRHLAMGGCQP